MLQYGVSRYKYEIKYLGCGVGEFDRGWKEKVVFKKVVDKKAESVYGGGMDYKSKAHRGLDVPVFEETIKAYESLEFLRDGNGRWTQLEIKAGWYQDAGGNLYQYDGVIWDEVPKERVEKLEYLG